MKEQSHSTAFTVLVFVLLAVVVIPMIVTGHGVPPVSFLLSFGGILLVVGFFLMMAVLLKALFKARRR